MDENCFYRKVFDAPDSRIVLTNPEPARAYADEKRQLLLESKNDSYAHSAIKQQLLSFFQKIYAYDCENAIFPNSFPGQDVENHKKQKLLVQDIYWYVGLPLKLFHQELINRNSFSFIEEYVRVLLEIPHPVTIKINRKMEEVTLGNRYQTVDEQGNAIDISTPKSNDVKDHAIATTYLLPPLIENILAWYLKNSVLALWLDGIRRQRQYLTETEKNILGRLDGLEHEGHVFFVGNKEDFFRMVWTIGRKYNILPDDDNMKDVFCKENVMIGNILRSSYARSIIKEEYFQLLECLFDSKRKTTRLTR